MKEKFASIQEINDKVKTFWRLKSVMKFDYKRMVYPLQDHSLNSSIGSLPLAKNHILLQRFHREDISTVLLLYQVDFTKRSPANHLDNLEIFDTNIL